MGSLWSSTLMISACRGPYARWSLHTYTRHHGPDHALRRSQLCRNAMAGGGERGRGGREARTPREDGSPRVEDGEQEGQGPDAPACERHGAYDEAVFVRHPGAAN